MARRAGGGPFSAFADLTDNAAASPSVAPRQLPLQGGISSLPPPDKIVTHRFQTPTPDDRPGLGEATWASGRAVPAACAARCWPSRPWPSRTASGAAISERAAAAGPTRPGPTPVAASTACG
ncbi:hypothetical protein DDF65_21560 [Caulobacter radicis]|uniref:Uncharacterized protein n=1 Tax=Caulobacter radicis TaxID=2172650 RepID=A0A2T9IZS0_9CAUL|nr:hypothetical protein DDF65_21560 [Caulobacter radicis]